MTTDQQTPTEVQVLMARVSVKADKKLGRDSPDYVKAVAATLLDGETETTRLYA